MSNFGETLNAFLEETKTTQTYIADIIGCTRPMIYSVLKNEKKAF